MCNSTNFLRLTLSQYGKAFGLSATPVSYGAIALWYPLPFVIDDSSWKSAAESFAITLTLTLGSYESAIALFLLTSGVNTPLLKH